MSQGETDVQSLGGESRFSGDEGLRPFEQPVRLSLDQAMLAKTVTELKDLFTKVCNHPLSK